MDATLDIEPDTFQDMRWHNWPHINSKHDNLIKQFKNYERTIPNGEEIDLWTNEGIYDKDSSQKIAKLKEHCTFKGKYNETNNKLYIRP